jgi:hypothetical protein
LRQVVRFAEIRSRSGSRPIPKGPTGAALGNDHAGLELPSILLFVGVAWDNGGRAADLRHQCRAGLRYATQKPCLTRPHMSEYAAAERHARVASRIGPSASCTSRNVTPG